MEVYEKKIIIKNTRTANIYKIVSFVLSHIPIVWLMYLFIKTKDKEVLIVPVIICVWMVKHFFEWVLSEFRTITMDDVGCTVEWFGLKKAYRWDEFKTVKEEYYRISRHYYAGMFFSVKGNPQGRKVKKIRQSKDFLKDFYVFYYDDSIKAHYKEVKESFSYPVDREELIKYLERWGVKIESSELLLYHLRISKRQELWNYRKAAGEEARKRRRLKK